MVDLRRKVGDILLKSTSFKFNSFLFHLEYENGFNV